MYYYETNTTEGPIPHLAVMTEYGVIQLPVVVIVSFRDPQSLPVPVRDEHNRLLYALPGGGRYVA